MSDLFYSHLVPIDDTLQLLNDLSVTESEREKLESMVVATYHQKMLETILREIAHEHHDHVVSMIAEDPYNLAIMIEIKSHNPNVEEAIIDAGRALSQELAGLLATKKPRNL